MLRTLQRVAVPDVEAVVVHVVQEHVHAAEVVGLPVDFLSVKPLHHILLAKNAEKVQEERTRSAGRVVDLVDALAPRRRHHRQEITDLAGRVELTALRARVERVHLDEILVAETEHVNAALDVLREIEVADAFKEGGQEFVAFGDRAPETLVVRIEAAEEPLHVVFARLANGRSLDGTEVVGERGVQFGIPPRGIRHIDKELGGRNEDSLGSNHRIPAHFRLLVAHVGIVIHVPILMHSCVCPVGDVLGDEAVEEAAEGIVHELDGVDLAAMHEVGRHLPDEAPQLVLQFLCTRIDIDFRLALFHCDCSRLH